MKATILAIITSILALTMMVITLNNPKCVNGWTLFPARYWVGVENGLTKDTLNTHCIGRKPHGDLGERDLPVHGYFNWTFKSQVWGKSIWECNFTWPNHGRKYLEVFEITREYVDQECGRHCFWKAQDDGFYLYDNIRKHQYDKKADWDKF